MRREGRRSIGRFIFMMGAIGLFVGRFAPLPSPLSPRVVWAAFEDTGTGARGTALGDNYVSMGDDVLSLMYNPASLARVRQREFTTEYSKLYTGLSDGSNLAQYYVGYGQPVRWGGTLAVGLKQFSLDSLYKERTLSLGYGEWLTPEIAIGGALKQLYHSFGVPNMVVDDNGNIQSGTPSFFAENGNSNTAYAGDLGMLYRWTDRHTLGLSIQNINEPNIALNPADHEVVHRTIRGSLAYEARREVTLAAAIASHKSLDNQTDTTFTGSAEKRWPLAQGDQVALRGSLAAGSREFRQMSVGAGYRFTSLEIDYAFVFNMTGLTPGNTMGTHRFSLTYRFGPVGIPPKEAAKAKNKTKSKTRTQTRTGKAMPTGYEYPEGRTVEPENRAIPAETPATKPAPNRPLPREMEIEITPEEIGAEGMPGAAVGQPGTQTPEPAIPLKVEDISVSVVFDADYDGVPDESDRCPNTAYGLEVDARGCAANQVDHHGNPLPKSVHIEFLPAGGGSPTGK